ncbi:MAG: LPD38 domain-containing protein, partial [Pseudomonadota bacterium]
AQFLDHGTFDWATYRNTGPGLKQILEPFNADLDGVRAYAVARRAVDLEGRSIDTGVPLADAQAVVAAGSGKYAAVFDQIQKYQDSVVDYLRDSGVLKPEAVDAMRAANADYVPFFRMVEGAKGGVGAGFGVRNPIKAIHGSERVIIDPLESIVKNTYLYTALAERNAVGRAFGDLVLDNTGKVTQLAEDLGVSKVKTPTKPIEVTAPEVQKFLDDHGIVGTGEAFDIFRPNALRPAPNQIRYFEEGKPVTLELPPDVAEAFNATDRQSAGMLVQILAVPAKTLRAGSVLTPDFMMRNVIRDQLSAYTFSKNGYIPVWDMVSGALSLAKKDGAFQDWLKSGGANATMMSMDRQYLQQHLIDLNKATGLGERAWNVAKTPIEVLRIASELMENATRLGEFKRAMVGESGKAAIQDAGFESREVTLDFQRIGAQTRSLNMIAAFMNASVEGMDRAARAFKDAPIGTTAKVAAGITMPSVLLWYANNGTPERQARWKEIPNWERDMFWIVMTDEHTYRIPKPFEVGIIFGSLPERMLDKFSAENPDAMKNFMGTLRQAFGVNVMPTAAMPALEHATNHSFFTGNALIPDRLKGILPEYQQQEYTSQLTRAVGGMVGAFPGLHDKSVASPIVIDNYVRGWTGSMGAYVTQMLDAGLRKAGVLPDPPQPIATLADIPVVKAFVVRYPSASAQSVQTFYEDYGQRKTVYATFQYLVKNGDPNAAIKESDIAPGAFAKLDGIHESIGQLNNNIRMVYRNPDITPAEKRQLIDTMYGQMIEMSRAGNEAMRDVDKALAK